MKWYYVLRNYYNYSNTNSLIFFTIALVECGIDSPILAPEHVCGVNPSKSEYPISDHLITIIVSKY